MNIPLVLTIEIISGAAALALCSALVATLTRSTPRIAAARLFSLLALLGSGAALGGAYPKLFSAPTVFEALSVFALVLSVANLLALLVVHHTKLASSDHYPDEVLSSVRLLAYVAFGSLVLYVLAHSASLTGLVL